MSAITKIVTLAADSNKAVCESTSNLDIAFRVSGGGLSLTSIIDIVDNDTDFYLSEKAKESGSYELTFTEPSLTEKIELQILSKLQNAIDDYVIELSPDEGSKYKLTHPNGALLIHYSGSAFNSIDFGIMKSWLQERIITYQIYVVGRSLRNNVGVQRKFEQIRAALTSFIPYKCKTLFYETNESFVTNDEITGEWWYEMWVSVNTNYKYGD
jgi:hypothetical protein